MKEYFVKYRSRIILMGLFVFLIHGAKLHSRVVGIDTEDIIHLGEDFYGGWLTTGRQGLFLIKWLTDSLIFQPHMAGLLTLVFFTGAASGFFLLWDKVFAQKKAGGYMPWVAGGLFLVAHPIITEQFYFTLQSVEICISLLLTALVLFLIVQYREKKAVWRLLVSTLILVLNFSVYQAFVPIFIFGTVSVLLTDAIGKLQRKDDISARELLRGMIPYLCVFLVAFLVNTLITNLFFSSSDYLNDQILWGKFAFVDNLKAIFMHVLKVFVGYEQVYYHFSFGLLCLAAVGLIVILYRSFSKNNRRKGVIAVVLFYLFALFVTPFLMTIVCGGAPVIRSQLVLPLITGYLAYLDVSLLAENVKKKNLFGKVAVAGMTVICVVGIWSQTSTTMALYYTDEMRYAEDEYLGRELIEAIDIAQWKYQLPVAVIGTRPFKGNGSCVIGETMGTSFFDYDDQIEPKYYWSTRRVVGFLNTLGADYYQVGEDDYDDAMYYSTYMPVWPEENSVQRFDDMIVVKIGDIEED